MLCACHQDGDAVQLRAAAPDAVAQLVDCLIRCGCADAAELMQRHSCYAQDLLVVCKVRMV